MSNFTHCFWVLFTYFCKWKRIWQPDFPQIITHLSFYIMKQLSKAPYGTPSVEVIEGSPAGLLCASNTNGGNTEDLFFEDWQKLLGGGGVL